MDANGNNVILKDVDAMISNRYDIRLLGDVSNMLNVTYNILSIERIGNAPYTVIVPSKRSSLDRCGYLSCVHTIIASRS